MDVHATLDSVLRLAANHIRRRGTVLTDYSIVPPNLADSTRLAQVILNLVMNAAQAIPESDPARHEIRLRTSTDADGWVRIAISDTGTGIPPHLLKHLFDPFFTTKPVGDGTGLGLSICHGIIQALGGEILVESELGKGSTFTLRLPPAEDEASPQTASNVSTLSSRRGDVLIIDDEPAMLDTLKLALANHKTTCASNGTDALALCEQTDFDVILCDLMMPGLTGMDVHEELVRHYPHLAERVIFLTGGAFTPRAQAFLNHNPNVRLEKPFRLRTLREAVERGLIVRNGLHEPEPH